MALTVVALNAQNVLVSVIVLSVVYYVFFQLTTGARRRAMIRERGCLPVPQYPAKDRWLGTDMFREAKAAVERHELLETLSRRFEKMGVRTYAFPFMGISTITTIEPENLKAIQAVDFKNWSLTWNRKMNFRPFLGIGIFTTDGTDWQHSRNMLRPNFVRSQIATETFESHISHMIARIPKNGETVDLQDLFFCLTLDTATEFLFGESTNCLAPGFSSVSSDDFAEAFNRGQQEISKWNRLGMFAIFASRKQLDKDAAFMHRFVDSYVEKGLAKMDDFSGGKSPIERYIFIDELCRQTQDRKRIRSELLNILLAGRDTTASLLSNVWWVLSKRPDIWTKLQAEVDSLNGSRPGFERLKDLKYLRAVLNESLRLHPVVPLNGREATADTTLPLGGGPDGSAPLLIKKGQIVTWSVWAMHRRKDFYGPDAEEFRPERWLGEKGLRPGWEYLPFNGGPRICLGQQFALTEASYTTVRLMQEFRNIESRDPEPWREWLALTCAGAGGCKVALTPAGCTTPI